MSLCVFVRDEMTVCVCMWTLPPRPLAILPRLLSPSVLPTSPRLGAQATVGGCHWEVTLTTMGDSLEAGKRGSCLPQPRTHPFCPESPDPKRLGRMCWAGLPLAKP